MALSQKHAGKILTPWFNRDEWEYVYNLIYSNKSNKESLKQAQDIMNIWKGRLPSLFAGVEATLVIVSALVYNDPSEYNVKVMHGSSIMRFLNTVCASENNRENTIFKTAKRKNLPDWIIQIRHVVSHGQKVPNRRILQSALDFCLKWLQAEYWGPELRYMTDCVIDDSIAETLTDGLANLMHICYIVCCCKYSQSKCYEFQNIPPADRMEIIRLAGMPIRNNTVVDNLLVDLWERSLKLVTVENELSFLNCIANEMVLLISKFNVMHLKGPDIQVPIVLTKVIHPYTHSLHAHGMLTNFINILVHWSVSNSYDEIEDKSKIASLLLRDIFKTLLKLKGKHANLDLSKYNFIAILNTITKSPTNNMILFYYPLLKLCDFNNDIVDDYTQLITTFCGDTELAYKNATVYDSESLLNLLPTEVRREICGNGNVMDSETVPNNSIGVETFLQKTIAVPADNAPTEISTNWVKVQDASKFIECPLGILPWQDRTTNPCINTKF